MASKADSPLLNDDLSSYILFGPALAATINKTGFDRAFSKRIISSFCNDKQKLRFGGSNAQDSVNFSGYVLRISN